VPLTAKALAALTKPFRAGVQCRASAGAADAAGCECRLAAPGAAACECRLAAPGAAACECRLPPCYQPAKALAALTKPFRAGVQGKCRSFEMQLAADAGLLHVAQPAADAGCCLAPASEGTCCTNEALQGWCAVQRQVPELRDAAGCGCRLAARGAAACGCRLPPCPSQRRRLLH